MPTPPVLLIGGQLLTAELWAPQRPRLEALGGAVVCDNAGADSIAGLAEDILADAPPRFALVSHAMGGFIAFEILRRAPERVTRLALISTLAPADTPAQTQRREGYLKLVQSGAFERVIDERIPILLHPDRRDDPALTGLVRRMAAATGAEAFLRQQRAIMTRPDSRPSLAAIACPTLILFGRQDGIVTLGHQQEMLVAIPDARLEIVEACGHLLTLEQPEVTSGLLSDFLARGA